ncbi:Lsr2 family protein [Arthrobacter sp. M4]|uniref:histone-like nucleoid-structuring protein Lsr2 n=1 Tax=Arthrobacter sp. M4 TaxID=218160 RepID=UPI001CDC06B9|nr:Lsr2 family protein [Arthrobacter sp. M4]MCA4134529.1 Lsr2 family protein [Arthrobacter sp. M4]
MAVEADALDGGPATQVVRFSLDGVQYEIALNDANADRLRQALEPYVATGRKLRAHKKKPDPRSLDAATAKAVREWASAQGIRVSPRGRVRYDVVDRFLAHAGE